MHLRVSVHSWANTSTPKRKHSSPMAVVTYSKSEDFSTRYFLPMAVVMYSWSADLVMVSRLVPAENPPQMLCGGSVFRKCFLYFFFPSSSLMSTLLLVEERRLNSSMTLLNFFGSGLPEVYSRT